jgi:phage tail tape-measure protein
VAGGLAGKGVGEVANPTRQDELADHNLATGVGAGGGAATGAAIGAAGGPLGMAAGAAIGAVAGGAAGKGTGKASQIRDMRGDGLRYRHQASFA